VRKKIRHDQKDHDGRYGLHGAQSDAPQPIHIAHSMMHQILFIVAVHAKRTTQQCSGLKLRQLSAQILAKI